MLPRLRAHLRWFTLVAVLPLLVSGDSPAPSFKEFLHTFTTDYEALDLEHFTLDMRERLRGVADAPVLMKQGQFFRGQDSALASFDRKALDTEDRLLYDLVHYEIAFQTERINLEEAWVKAGRPMPEHSLYDLPDREKWYALFIRRFTGTDITPEQVFQLGQRETDRCLREIDKIRRELGFADSASFQKSLGEEHFFITDKQDVVHEFARIDSTVRSHLHRFVGMEEVPVIVAQEWPDAGPNTPPGMYLNHEGNDTTVDVFQFNFYGGRYNRRAMTWIYMHEAIPGHHLQWTLRHRAAHKDLRAHVRYPGNFEGWACYVEYYGDELGVFTDPYQRLGKWEWDLVRSVRLVLDAGIHYYGWTHQQALDYWKQHIPGQDAIAEREVTRVTNWAAQALSYKVGADRIQRMRDRMQAELGPGFNAARFHRAYLDMGQVPMEVVEKNMAMP